LKKKKGNTPQFSDKEGENRKIVGNFPAKNTVTRKGRGGIVYPEKGRKKNIWTEGRRTPISSHQLRDYAEKDEGIKWNLKRG